MTASTPLVPTGRTRLPRDGRPTGSGRTLTAHGRFASFDGRQVIYNPRYELSAG